MTLIFSTKPNSKKSFYEVGDEQTGSFKIQKKGEISLVEELECKKVLNELGAVPITELLASFCTSKALALDYDFQDIYQIIIKTDVTSETDINIRTEFNQLSEEQEIKTNLAKAYVLVKFRTEENKDVTVKEVESLSKKLIIALADVYEQESEIDSDDLIKEVKEEKPNKQAIKK